MTRTCAGFIGHHCFRFLWNVRPYVNAIHQFVVFHHTLCLTTCGKEKEKEVIETKRKRENKSHTLWALSKYLKKKCLFRLIWHAHDYMKLFLMQLICRLSEYMLAFIHKLYTFVIKNSENRLINPALSWVNIDTY